jgi:hypothetical protein
MILAPFYYIQILALSNIFFAILNLPIFLCVASLLSGLTHFLESSVIFRKRKAYLQYIMHTPHLLELRANKNGLVMNFNVPCK